MTHYCREVKTRRNISDQLTQTSDNHLNKTTPPKCATVMGNMTNLKIFDNKMPKAPGKDMEWASVAGMGFQLTLVRAAGGSGCWWVGVVGSGDLSATTTHRPPQPSLGIISVTTFLFLTSIERKGGNHLLNFYWRNISFKKNLHYMRK